MKIVFLICRVLLGLGFVVFGLNGFLHFISTGPMPPADSLAGKFFEVFMGSPWNHVVSALQVFGGLFVLLGRTAPIGLTILGPILFNVLCFHAFLTGGKNIGLGVVFTVFELVLIYAYRANFRGIWSTDAVPTP